MIVRVIFLGTGFQSKGKYMFGKVTVQIKLVEGDSAGTVTAFYVSNDSTLFDPKLVSLVVHFMFIKSLMHFITCAFH